MIPQLEAEVRPNSPHGTFLLKIQVFAPEGWTRIKKKLCIVEKVVNFVSTTCAFQGLNNLWLYAKSQT